MVEARGEHIWNREKIRETDVLDQGWLFETAQCRQELWFDFLRWCAAEVRVRGQESNY
jgi:hypothetical protein